jgi:hypothetical protein
MAEETFYMAQPFRRRRGKLVIGMQVLVSTVEGARREAERLASEPEYVGAVAMAMKGDLDLGTAERPVILAKFGETLDLDQIPDP